MKTTFFKWAITIEEKKPIIREDGPIELSKVAFSITKDSRFLIIHIDDPEEYREHINAIEGVAAQKTMTLNGDLYVEAKERYDRSSVYREVERVVRSMADVPDIFTESERSTR